MGVRIDKINSATYGVRDDQNNTAMYQCQSSSK